MKRVKVETTEGVVRVNFLSDGRQASLLSPVVVEEIVILQPAGKYVDADTQPDPPTVEILRDELTNQVIAIEIHDQGRIEL